jgi:hypothetical protein
MYVLGRAVELSQFAPEVGADRPLIPLAVQVRGGEHQMTLLRHGTE